MDNGGSQGLALLVSMELDVSVSKIRMVINRIGFGFSRIPVGNGIFWIWI